MAQPTVCVGIDLSSATEEDLNRIKNDVLARLAERASAATNVSAGLAVEGGYDRHGSGHARATPPVLTTT